MTRAIAGVLKDERVKSSSNVVLRRVTYKDSVTGKEYCFITNELTLPPGVIALLYKLRWDIGVSEEGYIN